MTNSSSNRIVAAISDSATCIGLANWLAIPSSASTRQISFRINRVAISIIATYSNNSISRNEAVGAIQFIKCMLKKLEGIGRSQCPSGVSLKSRGQVDRGERVSQLPLDITTTSTERCSHCDNDNSRD